MQSYGAVPRLSATQPTPKLTLVGWIDGVEPQPEGVELVAVPVTVAATQPTATATPGVTVEAEAHGPAVELVASPVPLAATQPTAAPCGL